MSDENKDQDILAKAKQIVDDLQKSHHELTNAVKEVKDDSRQEVKDILTRVNAEADKREELKDQLDQVCVRMEAISKAKDEAKDGMSKEEVEYNAKCEDFLRFGETNVTKQELKKMEKELFEKKGLSVDSNVDGGFTVGTQLDTSIRKVVIETSPMMRYANVVNLGKAESYTALFDVGGETSGWVGEREARSETATASLKETEIHMREVYTQPSATQRVLDQSGFNLEQWLSEQTSRELARKSNEGAVIGTGVKQPQGYTNYGNVVSAAFGDELSWNLNDNWGNYEVIKSGSAAALGATDKAKVQNLIKLSEGLKVDYLGNARWWGNRATRSELRLLMDGDDQLYWQPSIQAGVPSKLLDYEYVVMYEAPGAGANKVQIYFGDMAKAYTVITAGGTRMIRDNVTVKGKILYYTTMSFGGAVTNFEALKGIKNSA